MLEGMDMTDHILFATDYPHWDFDAPNRAVPRSLGPAVRERIMRANAHMLYGLNVATDGNDA
jgi:predicted TIM-barrel fold metal-dependent hydrolase